MGRKTTLPMPTAARVLAELGDNIRLARLRRRLPATLVAERAGMARVTLRGIERGDPQVSIAAYANVLHSLGLIADLALVARDDALGRKLQDAGLEVTARAPRARSKKPREA